MRKNKDEKAESNPVSIYDQPLAVIDLTQDDDMEAPDEIPEEMLEEVQQEWLVIEPKSHQSQAPNRYS